MKKYESPKIVFNEMRLNESIADKCWAWVNNGILDEDECYYNTPGPGYVKFRVFKNDKKNGCSGSELSVAITDFIGIVGVEDQKQAQRDFDLWWNSIKNVNNSSNFKGEGYDEKPGIGWS